MYSIELMLLKCIKIKWSNSWYYSKNSKEIWPLTNSISSLGGLGPRYPSTGAWVYDVRKQPVSSALLELMIILSHSVVVFCSNFKKVCGPCFNPFYSSVILSFLALTLQVWQNAVFLLLISIIISLICIYICIFMMHAMFSLTTMLNLDNHVSQNTRNTSRNTCSQYYYKCLYKLINPSPNSILEVGDLCKGTKESPNQNTSSLTG